MINAADLKISALGFLTVPHYCTVLLIRYGTVLHCTTRQVDHTSAGGCKGRARPETTDCKQVWILGGTSVSIWNESTPLLWFLFLFLQCGIISMISLTMFLLRLTANVGKFIFRQNTDCDIFCFQKSLLIFTLCNSTRKRRTTRWQNDVDTRHSNLDLQVMIWGRAARMLRL